MSAVARARQSHAPPFIDPPGYSRHRPERTLLYQLVEQHYPAFRELRAAADRPLPDFVQQEFDAYLKCGQWTIGRPDTGLLKKGISVLRKPPRKMVERSGPPKVRLVSKLQV